MRNHHFNTVIAAREFVGQDFAAKHSFSPSNQAGSRTSTAGRNTCRDLVLAAIARVFHAPADADGWWWRAANRGRCTTGSGAAKAAGFDRGRGSERKHGSSHASRDQSTQRVHRFLSCWKVEYQRWNLVSLATADCATGRVGSRGSETTAVSILPK